MRPHLGVDVKRYAKYGAGDVDDGDHETGALAVAPLASFLRMHHRDVSPDRQSHREADRDRVTYLSEVRVEQHEDAPAVRVGISAGSLVEVHVDRVRNVFDHHEEIGHGESGENLVGGSLHLATRQHDNIEHIGD